MQYKDVRFLLFFYIWSLFGSSNVEKRILSFILIYYRLISNKNAFERSYLQITNSRDFNDEYIFTESYLFSRFLDLTKSKNLIQFRANHKLLIIKGKS